jgi:hypothetical protein
LPSITIRPLLTPMACGQRRCTESNSSRCAADSTGPFGFVDVHELQFRVVPRRAQRQSADATETVDANLDRHFSFLRMVSGARLDTQRAEELNAASGVTLRNAFILLES